MFPESQQDCKDLATEFIGWSQAGFNNCVGCIDGMLLWMEKLSKQQCVEAGVDSGKLYYGRKVYGLNLQVVCDATHHFIAIILLMCLCSTQHLHQTICHSSHLLYIKNYLNVLSHQDIVCMYVNDSNMAVPYPNQGHGPKDDFNFFHLQVWINIECAFGMLTNHWHILKNALSSTLSINEVVALTSCLCHLHNFCIYNGSAKVPARYKHDVL